MKKITLCLCFAFLSSVFMTLDAQVLNQNANWPNPSWSVTGVYTVSASPDLSFEADPTVDPFFAFDDDDAGNGSDDNIAAESPVIDLTAAFGAGETWLTIDVDYVYRKFSVEEYLRIQYYDADSGLWVNWEAESLPGNDNVLTDNFCAGTPTAYTSEVLNIGGFTANQQTNFQYRIEFDDDPNGPAYEYGFCMQSPTIMSAIPPSCPDPSNLSATVLNATDASLSWDELGTAALWNVELLDITAGDTQTMTATDVGVSNPFIVMGLTPGNDYEYYVQSDCDANGTSNWVGPVAWTQPLPGNVCETAIEIVGLPYNTTDDTANYGDNYDGVPGTDCGSGSAYLGGDDVVYQYTATADTSINIIMSNNDDYTGIFVYANCSDIGTACIAGGVNGFAGGNIEFDLSVTNGVTYYFVVSSWPAPQTTTYTLDITENTCTDATVTYTVVDDCANSGGFLIAVDVTDLGSANELEISDSQGGSQTVSAVGMYNVGPFDNGTPLVITVTDVDDSNCILTSESLTQEVCPPTNDLCENATPIACGETLTDQTTIGATGGSAVSCNGSIGDDVWFQFTGDGSEVTVTVDASVQEAQIGVFESTDGTCAGFTLGTCIASVDDLGGNPTSVTFQSMMNTEYFIQVGNWINGDPGLIFEISVSCTTCPNPSAMTLDAIALDAADISWTAGNTETSWNLEWVAGSDFTPGNGEEDDSATVSPDPNTALSSLTEATTYFVYYQADCTGGNTSEWVGPFTFYTGHCIPTGTSVDTNIENFTTTNGSTNISNLASGLGIDNYEDNFDTGVVTSFATSSFDFNVEIVGPTVGCAIWIDWNNNLDFEASEVVFSTTGYEGGPFAGTITVPGGTPNGDYRMRVMIDWNDPNPGDDDACSFGAGRGEVEDYKVTVADAPTDILDFYNLQFPEVGTINVGGEYLVFAQCFESGLTDTTNGQSPGIEAWIGYSDADTDPSGTEWTWVPADFNLEVGNNDEYFINLGAQINAAGVFYYASRWRLNGGLFTYGGIQPDGTFGGEWGDNGNISGVLTINPPINDDCAGAIALTPGTDFAANPIDGTVAGATLASETNVCGLNGPGVWYSVVVPADGVITIETGPDLATGNTEFDSVIEAYSGDCGTLTLIECDDDDADTFNFSILELTGLTAGETIYIRVWEFNGDESEPFAISAYNSTLSTDDFDFENGFTYYPNPVKDELILKAQNEIQFVRVFNMLGQEVLKTSPNSLESKLKMSRLNSGAYFVEVTIDNKTNVIRVVKK